ncbi:lysyl-tRNA synthetase class II [Saccharopolyspora erythraea NRRL 2338]|uniref:Lysine--tRNA ligase n=1 Tax=Saccharopolyspora erythraea TaxID=1836 RepID=A0ABN1DDB7_SACER|nr:bifunctional lysylphosphatidylglycerol synthetase/lysine--tRNA ligase LysX [Saccharopolyspora erythraea]EQD86160.1 lysyl-tRNA synthetase [Saccharopolyspora erythraea D]PFG97679.1 lysyl-tRNA synthetase class II [Saccharopolyspora erythraea NRRL 2338]QRK87832.1 bifunctional lysylphosphatidylglycerol synthetase/lysine--tRNA ligase LysX [Saccharopolyspora erythraea]
MVEHARRFRWRDRVPGAAAGLVFAIALLCSFAAVGLVLHGHVQPVRRFVDDVVFPAPPNLAYGAFLVVLAAALKRRKWVAHRILAAIVLLQLLVDLAVLLAAGGEGSLWIDEMGTLRQVPVSPWPFGVNVAVSLAALTLLVWARGEFYGRTGTGSVRRAAATFCGLVAASVALGFGLVTVFPGSLDDPRERLTWTVERVLGGAVVFDVTRVGHAPGWVNLLLGLFGSAALFATLFVLFAAQRVAAALTPEQEQRIRQLLDDRDGDSLGYFATRRDRSALFSASGKAAISYRPVAGVCLAGGDPVGDREAWAPAIQDWLAMCREYTWMPAAMGLSEPAAAAFARAGLKVLQLGDEAVLHTAEFGLAGRDMRPVRQAVNRVHRAGYRTRVRRHRDVPGAEMREIVELVDRWRTSGTERGFSMALGRLGDPQDGDCVLVEAVGPDGRRHALLSLVPWGRDGLSLDLMRRDPDADNGLVELMVSGLMRTAPVLGVTRVSLNFAVFRSAFEEGARLGAGPVLRAWRGLLLLLSRWWQLESLYRSNVKYQPHWYPRYIAFAEHRELARVGLASAIAEGFVPAFGHRRAMTVSGARPEASATAPTAPQPTAEPEQQQVRRRKLAELREAGVDPYPPEVPRTQPCRAVAEHHGGLEPGTRTGETTSVAGRVMRLRDHGGLCFATVRDWSGDLQVLLTADDSGHDLLVAWRGEVDLGDQVSVTGEVVTSDRGELTVLAKSWTLAGKCLHPLPDKHRGLSDPHSRVRARHLDLITRPEARSVLRARSAATHALRDVLVRSDFVEVETPVLQPVRGGANARPFSTHINAYDLRLYLRIAPELYLKRLCVGGVERLFEIGRAFRNEGVSHKHNPEFTMLEAYQAFGDYTTMRELCRELVVAAAVAATGSTVVTGRDRLGRDVATDLADDWPVIGVHEAVSAATGEEVTADTPVRRLRRLCDDNGIAHLRDWGRGAVLLELYERLVEAETTGPTFYRDFPAEVSPLARPHRHDARLAERWDLVAFGTELGTGYSELTDPVEQRRRLADQARLAAEGDAEAMDVDEDFLTALEYAMPPTGGLGLGVDRLVMLLTGRSIRDTLAFPLVKPQRAT